MIGNLRHLKCIDAFANGLMKWGWDMDYKKIIIEMVEEEQNTGKLRFVYMILAKYLKTKM